MILQVTGLTWACTSFCLDTPDGPVFAANLDLFIPGDGLVFANRRGIAKENIRRSSNGETEKWISKYGSVTFNTAGRGFVWSGMNEVGLVVSSMELKASEYSKPDERPSFDSRSWIQYVLDTCGSVQESIQVASLVRLVDDGDSPSHFLVADADGDCAVIEFLNGHLVCHTGVTLLVKALSNMRYDRALIALKSGGPRWWWSNPGQSAERFAGAATRLKSFSTSRDTSAALYALSTLTDVVAASHTKWNVVYDISKKEIRFRSAASPTVKLISIHDFDLSCKAPLLMLDVNAAIDGNVGRFFTLYDQKINLKIFRTLCDRLEIEVSAESAIELMKLFESFECAR